MNYFKHELCNVDSDSIGKGTKTPIKAEEISSIW